MCSLSSVSSVNQSSVNFKGLISSKQVSCVKRSYLRGTQNSTKEKLYKKFDLKKIKPLSEERIEDISKESMGVSAIASAIIGGIAFGGDIVMAALFGALGLILSPVTYLITRGSMQFFNKIIDKTAKSIKY